MKSTKKLLGVFSRQGDATRRLNQNVEMVGSGNFSHQTAEPSPDSQADLEKKIAEKTSHLSALYALTGPISQAGDMTGVLNDAVVKIIDVTGADAASIRLSDEQGARLVLTSHRGFPQAYTEEISIETGQGRIGRQILQTGEAIISEELVKDRRFHRGLLAKHGFRSAAYLPLSGSQRNVLGIMVLASRAPGRLGVHQSELFAAIAHQISVALENARLYQESERQKEVQKLLRELNEDITSLDVTSLVQKLTKKVREFFKVDVSDVRIAERGVWRVVGASGIETERLRVSNAKHVRGRSKWIVENRKPLLVADTAAAPSDLTKGTVGLLGIRGYAGIPLFGKGGDVVGILRALTYQPREFAQEEVDLLQQLANGAAVALDNARLFQEKERRAQEQHALRELLANLLLLDLDELLQRMTEQAVMLFRADYSRLRLFDEEGKIKTRAVAGDQEIVRQMSSKPERPELAGRGKWMLDNRRPLAVRDIALYSDHPSRGVKAGLHGYIGAPLFSRDRKPLGVIHVMTRSPRDFTPHDLSLLGQFANGAAVAIENAALLKKSENNLQQLRALREIDQAITSTLDLDKILNVLLEKIELVLPYGAATIRLMNREIGQLEPVACRNLDPEEWKTRQWRGGRGLANAVFEAKTPTIVRDVLADPRVLDTEFYRRNRLVSYLGVPLVAEGENLGVLNFYTKEEHEFSNEEVEFLSTLAGQAAVAIHHSQLYQKSCAHEAQLEETNRMLSALHEVAAAASEALDLGRVLRVAIEKITETFRFDATRIHIYDEQSDEVVLRDSCANDPDRFTAARSFRRGEGIVGKVVESGKALIFEDTCTDPLYRRISRTKVSDRFGYHFFGVFPVRGKLKTLGTLGCVGTAPRKLSPGEIQLLEAIADRIAVALESRELYEQLRRNVQELQTKTTELERANKAKNEFLSVMSHELRTPLNVIMSYARVVKEGMLGEINSEQEKALEKAINNSADLLRMVGGILEATSIEAGAVVLESYAVSPDNFLDSLRSNYDAPLEKELALHWDYPSGLPHMQTDSDKLKHILQNLINNAIKFTDKGRVTISARHVPEADALEFRVSDTGIGIPQDSLPVIFEMFRQVDSSASRPYGGVGLGLFIVKKLTELLGGTVEVESQVGRGSTFTVTIPMVLSLPRLL